MGAFGFLLMDIYVPYIKELKNFRSSIANRRNAKIDQVGHLFVKASGFF
jgi:hypothetical protein